MNKIHVIKDSHTNAIFMGEHDKMWDEGTLEMFLERLIVLDQQKGKLELDLNQSQIAIAKEKLIADMIQTGKLEIHE